ncbi:DUF2357 domain-containing protein [Pseudomonas aeruginosa]|uniref:DUF2357 domain-containing protein n=1 Tax=Pseudomonas aeruginosa TaxID=287 RepID=UPI00068AF48C|nr:DUF2357 domain-containing protein [Pseudomonas aeruginosa]
MTTLSCIDADGRRFDVVAEHLCAGFMEQGEYHFLCIAGAGLYIDDLPLAIGVRDGESFWLWSPGYFAGEVCAELLNSQGELLARYRLDVSPSAQKLGRESFERMLEQIFEFDPALLFGTESAQFGIGSHGQEISPHLQYSRLRRYGEQLLRTLKQVAAKPLVSLRHERTRLPAQQVKRLDRQSLHQVLRDPAALALLSPNAAVRSSPDEVRFDVPSVYEDEDNPANQALAMVLHEVLRRCRQVMTAFEQLATSEKFSESRSPLAPRLARRIAYLESLHRGLRKLQGMPPFCNQRRRQVTAAGLNVISAHPAYARAYRFGWYVLRAGLQGSTHDESLWITPTWEVFERWCYAMLAEQFQRFYPELKWRRHDRSTRDDCILWSGRSDALEIDILLQVSCLAVDQPPYCGFSSISRQRYPDIALTVRRDGREHFIVIDAKYRSSRSAVLEAMASAHLYRDSLRWRGRRPECALLLIPRGGAVPALECSQYRQDNAVGVVSVSDPNDAAELVRVLAEYWSDTPVSPQGT